MSLHLQDRKTLFYGILNFSWGCQSIAGLELEMSMGRADPRAEVLGSGAYGPKLTEIFLLFCIGKVGNLKFLLNFENVSKNFWMDIF